MNNEFQNIIKNSIIYNKISQSYLLSSNTNTNLTKYILDFINLINNEKFENINKIKFGELYFLVDGKDESIKKESVLNAIKSIQESSLSSNSSKYKILIIRNIENGSAQSLNSLLKFLEQSPLNLITVMTTNKRNSVLKTIRSRSFEINIKQEISTKGYDQNKFDIFFDTLFSDDEKKEQFLNEKNLNILNMLDKHLNNNDSNIFSFLYEFLLSNNWYLLVNYLYMYFHELYLMNTSETKFNNIYVNSKNLNSVSMWKIKNILLTTKKYLDIFKNPNLYFKIQKSAFITSLEEIYDNK